jgi:hypothetical protein
MKFMIAWQLHEGKLQDVLSIFSKITPEQDQALMGDNVKLVGRWHDLVRGQGVAIFESDNAEALSTYSLNWNAHMDLDIALVVEDEEARAIGNKMNVD